MTDPIEGLPRDVAGAYARIGRVVDPGLDDYKMMVLLEAAGTGTYAGLADLAPKPEIRALLEANGREETAHAHRVIKIIRRLYGVEFAVPAPADNPYAGPKPTGPLTADKLRELVAGELGGEALYEAWATRAVDPEVARLLRQNGKEERRHSERAAEALALLEA